jgi:hypothetical protein
MKVTTIALATVLTLTSTLALAQTTGTEGYGSVVVPSVGAYGATVGSSNDVPTLRNTGPAAALPSSTTFAQNSVAAPTGRMSNVRG